jgi:hypothetical protein
LQVSTVNTFATTFYDNGTLTGNTTTIGPIGNNTTYYWRVNATNPSGTSSWSTVWSFTTADIPAVPTLVSPADDTTDVSHTPTLTWNASSGATSYQLQVATDSFFVSIIYSDSSLTSTSQAISSLVSSTTYFWRVRAGNAGGSSAWSSVWRFTTALSSFVKHYPAEILKNARKPVTVYNLLGRVVSRSGLLEYRAMTSGYYIYKTGDLTKKNASLR